MEGSSSLSWSAQSDLSGLFYTGSQHTIELNHGHGAEEECKRILEIITSDIPESQIVDYSNLEEGVLSDLKKLGYSKTSPPCQLRIIESSSTIFRYGVYPVDGSRREPLVSFTIEAEGGDSPDVLIEMLELDFSEGHLSHFFIKNKTSFKNKLVKWVSNNVPVIEDLGNDP